MKKSIGSGRGSVYNIILKALQSGDKYGYEICKEVEEKTNGAYILKQPSLYSGLKRLEAQGEISSYWRDSALGGRRHYYSMTDSGKARLENSNFNWQDARDDIVDTLFEKSLLDETIESAHKDIYDLKSISEKNDLYQKDIDEVLENTKDLFGIDTANNEKQDYEFDNLTESVNPSKDAKIEDNQNETEEYVNYDSGDLFSMFKTVEQTENFDNRVDEQINSQYVDKQENLVVKSNFEDNDNIKDYSTDIELSNKNIDDVYEEFEVEETKINNEQKDSLEELGLDNSDLNKQNEQLDLFSFVNSSDEDSYGNKNKNNIIDDAGDSDKDEILNNFQDIEDNLKTIDVYTNKITDNEKESIDEDINKYDDEVVESNKILNENFDKQNDENNNIFSNEDKNIINSEDNLINIDVNLENSQKSIDEDNKTIEIQKNVENWLDEYRKNNKISNTFSNNVIFEKTENQFSNFEPYSTDFSFDKDFKFSNEFEEEKFNDENIDERSKNEVERQDFDYKNIFGDLVSKRDIVQNKDEISETNVDNNAEFLNNNDNVDSEKSLDNKIDFSKTNTYFENSSQISEELNQESNDDSFGNKINHENNLFVDDLPRNNNALNDINLTLMKDVNNNQNNDHASNNHLNDNDFEPYDTSVFDVSNNPFIESSTNSYQKNQNKSNYENYLNQNKSHNEYPSTSQLRHKSSSNSDNDNNIVYNYRTKDLSFDKKYANSHNNFEVPDYEVRYYRKYNVDNSSTRFLSINKLNLIDSFVLAFLICLFTTIILSISAINVEISGFQAFLFVVSYLIAAIILLLNFLKFISNKNKKVQHIKKVEMSYRLFISILIVILTIAINLFVGMNFNNIANYTASFILPIFYSILILINYPLRKFLSRFATFYN